MARNLHRWADPLDRPSSALTIRTCMKCGLQKHTVHSNDNLIHRSEFYEPDGKLVGEFGRTPECRVPGRVKEPKAKRPPPVVGFV
jgi:hypothetical protein